MKTEPIVTPRGFTIFCDDIRQEHFGKYTAVGIYHGGLYPFGPFPFFMPKLGMLVTYQQKISDGAFDININCHYVGASKSDVRDLVSTFIPKQVFENPPPIPSQLIDQDGEPILSIVTPMIIPLEISEAGRFIVRAERNGLFIRLGAMVVYEQTTPPNSPANLGS